MKHRVKTDITGGITFYIIQTKKSGLLGIFDKWKDTINIFFDLEKAVKMKKLLQQINK